jgi:integrase
MHFVYCLPVHSKGCSCTAALVRWCHVRLSKRLLHGSGAHTADWCCLLLYCSEDRGPTRNLLTSQFLTPAELRQMLQHCYRRADRQGLMLAAMLSLGVYNGFRWAAVLAFACFHCLIWQGTLQQPAS